MNDADSAELAELSRPVRDDSQQPTLFDVEPDWREQWWGMPSFEQQNATACHSITIKFVTMEDAKEFGNKIGADISTRKDSLFYPVQKHLSGQFAYQGNPTDSRYPICIPSKGRADCQITGKVLDRMGVSYRFFVEQTEADEYCKYLGTDNVVSMPFNDLGKGSVPARNYIWKWAKERGHKRHWTVDDNIMAFVRVNNNRKLRVYGGGFFRAMEDFVDRYDNLAMAGPHNKCFVLDRSPRLTPFLLNSRVYSCILLDTTLTHRWRGRYNEDTDLSLRLLKDGYCTLLFRALCMDKAATGDGSGSKGTALSGGNTDNVYNTGDHRRAFAESLKKQHPDVVEVVWKFNRWHHQVDYSPFKRNQLRPKAGVVPTAANNEYGMELVRTKESPEAK